MTIEVGIGSIGCVGARVDVTSGAGGTSIFAGELSVGG